MVITSEEQYKKAMAEIDRLTEKATPLGGLEKLDKEDVLRFKFLAEATEAYEDNIFILPPKQDELHNS